MFEMQQAEQEKQKFLAILKNNKNLRLLDLNSIANGLSDKKQKVAEKKGKKVDSEIEKLLIEKWSLQKKLPVVIEKETAAATIPKQALVDDILMNNKNYFKSLALKKRLWAGEEGTFANKDLEEWFKIYNQTQLNKAKKFLKKLKDQNDEQVAIGLHLRKFKLDGTEALDKEFEDSPRFQGDEIELKTKFEDE